MTNDSQSVGSLLANCKKLQSLRSEARQQAQDAQMAYEDLCDQTMKAWDKYYDAKNGEADTKALAPPTSPLH
jgi:hypothetical protein